jgi:AcrR family transcriptional regulator
VLLIENMTIATRKQREKEEMRSLILDAARTLFLEKGYHETSIRNIAEKIEYSPGTIYLYYKEKDDIFHALHQEGFRKLIAMMEPLQFVADPFERLTAMGRIYMEFAKNNKDFYDLMFIMQAPMNMEQDDCWVEGDHALEHLKQVLRDCQAVGRFQGKDIDDLSFFIWSTMHGMAALYCRERCQAYDDKDPLTLIDNSFKIFTEMLAKF